MALNPLVWSNGIPKLEISHVGISVVAHISDKNLLLTARRNYVYRKRYYYDGQTSTVSKLFA